MANERKVGFRPPGRSKSLVTVGPPFVHLTPYVTGGLKLLYSLCDGTAHREDMHDYGQYTAENGNFKPERGMPLLACRYKYIDTIGRGQSSVLLKAKDMFFGGRYVSIKVLHSHYHVLGSQETDCIRKLNLKDPFDTSSTLRLLNAFNFDDHYCLVFELLHPTPLVDYFKTVHFKPQAIEKIKKVAVHLLKALGFLQQQNVIHADLKPENILLKDANDLSSLKVVDFGNAIRCVHDELSLYYDDFELQTLLYRAPEVMVGLPFGLEVDMWSFGCILAELYTGKPLFAGKDKHSITEQMVNILGPLPESIYQRGKFYPDFKKYMSNTAQVNVIVNLQKKLLREDYNFANFLAQCLRYNPTERMTVSQAALHPFLASEFGFAYLLPPTKHNGNKPGYPTIMLGPQSYQFQPHINNTVSKRHMSSYELLHHGTDGHSVHEINNIPQDVTPSRVPTIRPYAEGYKPIELDLSKSRGASAFVGNGLHVPNQYPPVVSHPQVSPYERPVPKFDILHPQISQSNNRSREPSPKPLYRTEGSVNLFPGPLRPPLLGPTFDIAHSASLAYPINKNTSCPLGAGIGFTPLLSQNSVHGNEHLMKNSAVIPPAHATYSCDQNNLLQVPKISSYAASSSGSSMPVTGQNLSSSSKQVPVFQGANLPGQPVCLKTTEDSGVLDLSGSAKKNAYFRSISQPVTKSELKDDNNAQTTTCSDDKNITQPTKQASRPNFLPLSASQNHSSNNETYILTPKKYMSRSWVKQELLSPTDAASPHVTTPDSSTIPNSSAQGHKIRRKLLSRNSLSSVNSCSSTSSDEDSSPQKQKRKTPFLISPLENHHPFVDFTKDIIHSKSLPSTPDVDVKREWKIDFPNGKFEENVYNIKSFAQHPRKNRMSLLASDWKNSAKRAAESNESAKNDVVLIKPEEETVKGAGEICESKLEEGSSRTLKSQSNIRNHNEIEQTGNSQSEKQNVSNRRRKSADIIENDDTSEKHRKRRSATSNVSQVNSPAKNLRKRRRIAKTDTSASCNGTNDVGNHCSKESISMPKSNTNCRNARAKAKRNSPQSSGDDCQIVGEKKPRLAKNMFRTKCVIDKNGNEDSLVDYVDVEIRDNAATEIRNNVAYREPSNTIPTANHSAMYLSDTIQDSIGKPTTCSPTSSVEGNNSVNTTNDSVHVYDESTDDYNSDSAISGYCTPRKNPTISVTHCSPSSEDMSINSSPEMVPNRESMPQVMQSQSRTADTNIIDSRVNSHLDLTDENVANVKRNGASVGSSRLIKQEDDSSSSSVELIRVKSESGTDSSSPLKSAKYDDVVLLL